MRKNNMKIDDKCFNIEKIEYELLEIEQLINELQVYLNESIKSLSSKNISKNEIFFPYYFYLTSLDILDNEILDINSFKNKFIMEVCSFTIIRKKEILKESI
mgnify:CR=1 FL=1